MTLRMLRPALALGLFWLAVPAWSAAEPPVVQPPAAKPALAPAPAEPGAAPAAPLPVLGFQVLERGPNEPWVLQVDNLGAAPASLAADVRLLWFEVQQPAAKAPRVCRLPKPLWPEFALREAELILPPGQSFRRSFDPRFFCFASLTQTLLVPNARVTPHFGWPERTRITYQRGKRIEEIRLDEPPFVAWMPSAVELGPKPRPGLDPASVPWVEPTEGVRNLAGAAFVLGPSYSAWAAPAKPDGDATLFFDMLDGADAEDERAATVSLGLQNRTKRDIPVFVRQELITYVVSGPDGDFECSSSPTPPPRDETAFTALRPGKTLRIVTRLLEVCERGRFGRPGLYQVSARLDVPWSGQHLGVDGFKGQLRSARSALLRVRSGELSFYIDLSDEEAASAERPRAGAAPAVRAGEPGPDEPPQPDDGAHDELAPPQEAPQLPDNAVE